MNILIVANHFPVCSARYAADAFRRLGHEVRHGGRAMGRNIWGMQVPEDNVWHPDGMINEVSGFPTCDLTIIMDSDPAVLDDRLFGHSWLNAARQNPKGKVVVWGVDNHVRDYRRPYFDHYFLAHKSVSVMPWETIRSPDSIEFENQRLDVLMPTMRRDDPLRYNPHTSYVNSDMTHLPCAYDPVAFPPSPIAWADREYDVCMIGVMYPKRWELVNAMRAAGLKVLAGTGLVYEAYRDAYHNSRVALVSSFNGDLPIRLFEGAGMGCAVLHDHIPDIERVDPDGDWSAYPSLWEYNAVDEAVALAKELQSNEGGADGNSIWARQHTWDARAQVIVDWFTGRAA